MSKSSGNPKPFLKWAGGKRQLISEIEMRLPENLSNYDTYIEPFIGGGAVLFHLLPRFDFKRIIVMDINSELILCYQIIQSHASKLIKALKQLENHYPPVDQSEERKEYYYSIRTDWNIIPRDVFKIKIGDKIKRVAKTIFLNRTCFNGLFRVNSKGEFNVPVGDYDNPKITDEDNLMNVSRAIKSVEFIHCDFSVIESYLGEKTFVYFDPPYRPLTTSSSFTSYSKSGFNDDNQRELALLCDKLNKQKVNFLLSNSDPKNADKNDDFFDELYSSFTINRVYAKRAINSKGSGRGKITEILVQNYI